jgi:hypothetical protein
MPVNEAKREDSFCTYTIHPDTNEIPLIVLDATKDPRFANIGPVTGPLSIRFYAGAPIFVDNVKIGSLCILDDKSHQSFTEEQQRILLEMATIASSILVSEQKQYILENQLVLPIVRNMLSTLRNDFHDILTLKKELKDSVNGNSSTNVTVASESHKPLTSSTNNNNNNEVPRRNSNASAASVSSSRNQADLVSKWTAFSDKITDYMDVLESNAFQAPILPEDALSQRKDPKKAPEIVDFALYSFHLSNHFALLKDWVTTLQGNLQGIIDKNSELKIKYDYELNDDIEIVDENISWISPVLAMFFILQLQKWKNISVNFSLSGEEYLKNYIAPSRTRSRSRGNSQEVATESNKIKDKNAVLKHATTRRLVIPPDSPIRNQINEFSHTPNVTPNPNNPNNGNNIGVITLHMDVTMTNRFSNIHWIHDDYQFFQLMDEFFQVCWNVLQGQYQNNSNANENKLVEKFHISIPIVCRKTGNNNNNSPMGSPAKAGGKGKKTAGSFIRPLNLSPVNSRFQFISASIRSFNRSFWSSGSDFGRSRYGLNRSSSGDQNNEEKQQKIPADHPFYNNRFIGGTLTTLNDELNGNGLSERDHSDRSSGKRLTEKKNNFLNFFLGLFGRNNNKIKHKVHPNN